MTITQFIASLLYSAALEIPITVRVPTSRAMRDLMRCLRGMGC